MATMQRILMAVAVLALGAPARAQATSAAAFARTRTAAERAIHDLRRDNPDVDASWQPALPGPALVTGLRTPTRGGDPASQALGFARDHATLWGVAAQQLQVTATSATRERQTVHLGLAAQVGPRSVPVLDRRLTVTLDRASGQVLAVASDLLPVAGMRTATVGEQAAALRGLQAVGLCEGKAHCADLARTTPTRLAVLADLSGALPVWVVDVQAAGPLKRTAVLVDAWTGAALRATPVAID